jgi:menaquinol-cytochrome c reductase iron-sulfur subunit
VGALGVAGVPVAGLVASPANTPSPLQRRAGGADGWTAIARLEELAEAQPTQLPVMGAEVDGWEMSPDRRLGAVWLTRHGDSVTALSAVCPHLGCLIDRQGEQFNCPCHVSSFGADGHALEGPSPRSMDPIEARVREGSVEVRWVRFRLGVAERLQES